MEKNISIKYEEFNSLEELKNLDRELLEFASQAVNNAYAPYSKFRVGAALRLENGEIVKGNNQENAAYPSGLCAERVAIFAASANYPNIPIKAIAITVKPENGEIPYPISPCGACRQSIVEYESHFKNNIRIILRGSSGKITVFENIKSLLPFQFDMDDLIKAGSKD